MPLTCLSYSPSHSFSLFLSPLTFLLFTSDTPFPDPQGRWNEQGVLLSQYFCFTWKPEIGCLKGEVISVAEFKSKTSAHGDSSSHVVVCALKTQCSGYTSLFLLARCCTDITAIASLEREKASWMNSKLKYEGYLISNWCCCKQRKTEMRTSLKLHKQDFKPDTNHFCVPTFLFGCRHVPYCLKSFPIKRLL